MDFLQSFNIKALKPPAGVSTGGGRKGLFSKQGCLSTLLQWVKSPGIAIQSKLNINPGGKQ
jgi:hypothetical protein